MNPRLLGVQSIMFAGLICLCALLVVPASAATGGFPAREVEPGVRQVGMIRIPTMMESSGLAASRRFPGIFWTHNDGGARRRQVLYAVDRQGEQRAVFSIQPVPVEDWEDIAVDDAGQLYLGDLGNNEAKRSSLFVHQIVEPDPKNSGGVLAPKQSWELTFPGKPFDCESLFVYRGFGYVISKVFEDRAAQLFRFPLQNTVAPVKLELIATLPITSPVTSADLTADGAKLGVVAKWGAYVFRVDGDLARAATVEPHRTKFKDRHIEGCCFVSDGLLACAESGEIFLFTKSPFHPADANVKR